jgi:2-furoate---CoA ligase
VRPDDLSVILYTSGTTGRPKGVPLTQRAAYHRAISYLLTVGLRFRSDVRTLGAAPLYHTVGLHYVMCVSMLLNGTYFPVRELDGRGLLDLVERERLSFLFGSPTLFHAMLRAAAEAPVDTGSVTHVSFGSAPMPPSQLAALAALFPAAEISEVYGTTEISIPFVTRDAVAAAPGALHPTADHRVRVIAPGGSPEDEVGVGRDGELLADVSNGGCFHGYWNQPATTAARVRDGWYHTGDMFRRESDGSFRISGRLDDMFISGAENIHPAEVEQVLSGHPGIADVAVIGTPDERWGEVVTALVVRAHDRLTAEEIDRFCRQSALADFKRPRRILFVEAIERNASGKIVRREIRERAVRELVTGA